MANPKLTEGKHELPNGEGGVLEYFVHGSGGPLFFFIPPAWGPTCEPYRTAFYPLHSEYTMIYLNPRGSGGSSRPREESHMTTWHVTNDIEILREYLEVPHIPQMMAHSHGTAICLYYAIRFPQKVDKLILLAPAVEGVDRTAGQKRVKELRYNDPRFTAAFDAMPNSPTHKFFNPFSSNETFIKFMRDTFPVFFYSPELYMAEFEVPPDMQVWNALHIYDPENKNPPMIGEMKKIEARVWGVFGDVDLNHPIVLGDAIAKEIGSEGGKGTYSQTLYDRCAHMVWLERKDQFWVDLKSFLDKP